MKQAQVAVRITHDGATSPRTSSGSHDALLRIAGAIALAGFASGCTAGILVDENFATITDSRTSGVSITFQALDSNRLPTGTEYNFDLNGQPYISFDLYASDGATTPSYPGLINSEQYIPEGNYRVQYFQRSVGFAWSPGFAHAYNTPGSCTDAFNNESDTACEIYFFKLNYNCTVCTLPQCGVAPIQPLPTHDGFPVIDMCVAF